MQVMALGSNHSANFRGIQVKTPKERFYDEPSMEAIIHDIEYDYYSFSDETTKETEKAIKPYVYQSHKSNYPLWDNWEFSTVNVKPLSITKAEYDKLKQKGVSDNSIIEVYG